MIRTLRPAPGLMPQLAGWTFTGLLTALWPVLLPLFQLHGVLLAAALALDAYRLSRSPVLHAHRRVAESLPLGGWADVTTVLRFADEEQSEHVSALEVEVFDDPPEGAETEGLPARLELQGLGAEITWRLRPRRRGDARFGRTEVLITSPWKLWRVGRKLGEEQQVRVLPDYKPVMRYALLALGDRLGQMGIRAVRRRGEGLEFRELREYREGDSLRSIDWKATSRHRQLISRSYQEEKNQQIVLLLDCGRRMRAQDGDLTHFDHVLNASLLLSWVALRQGDAVGLLTMSGDERRLAPRKGGTGMQAILNSIYDLQTSLQPPDYLDAAQRLMAWQRRRALVIIVTNLRDEDADELLPALQLLQRRHLVLVVSLREMVLRQILEEPTDDLLRALEKTAVYTFQAAREAVHEEMRGRGALVLDAEPDRLAVRMVNRYLDIKRSGLL